MKTGGEKPNKWADELTPTNTKHGWRNRGMRFIRRLLKRRSRQRAKAEIREELSNANR